MGGCKRLLHGHSKRHNTIVTEFKQQDAPTQIHTVQGTWILWYIHSLAKTNVYFLSLLAKAGTNETCTFLFTSLDVCPEDHRRSRGNSGTCGSWQKHFSPKQQEPPDTEKGNIFILSVRISTWLSYGQYVLFKIYTIVRSCSYSWNALRSLMLEYLNETELLWGKNEYKEYSTLCYLKCKFNTKNLRQPIRVQPQVTSFPKVKSYTCPCRLWFWNRSKWIKSDMVGHHRAWVNIRGEKAKKISNIAVCARISA